MKNTAGKSTRKCLLWKVSPICIVGNSCTNIHLWKEFNRRARVVRRMAKMWTEGVPITVLCLHPEELRFDAENYFWHLMDSVVLGRMWSKPLVGRSCSRTNCSQTGSPPSSRWAISITNMSHMYHQRKISRVQTIPHHLFALRLCRNLACNK